MNLSTLENKGFSFINIDKLDKTSRQIIVIGSARGGTSLIAGALHHLGVFTGEKSSAPVFEDVLLSNAFESNNFSEVENIINKYDSEHSLWAWKRPAALHYLNDVERYVSNPLYIFIFKDIFAIANRNNISMKSDITSGLKKALDDYGVIVDFIQKTESPLMLVSAEKALQNKKDLIDAIIEINKDLLPNPNVNDAINFITPNPKQYLDLTRNTKSTGNVDSLDKSVAKGWAKKLYSDEIVDVGLYVDGQLVRKITANQLRQDLINQNISKIGTHGFTMDISDIQFKLGSKLEFIVESDITPINNGELLIDEDSCLSTLL